MLQEHAVRKYFQEGLDRGFSKEYLRQNLLRYGYDPATVTVAYHALSGTQRGAQGEASLGTGTSPLPRSGPQPAIPQRPQSPFPYPSSPSPSPSPSKLGLYVVLFVGLMVGVYLLATSLYNPSPTGFAVLNDQEAALEEISILDQQIEEKHTTLQQQLGELQQKDLTIEEKNKIIEEQISELEKLHQSISEERDKIRVLLLDLFNTIVDKPLKVG